MNDSYCVLLVLARVTTLVNSSKLKNVRIFQKYDFQNMTFKLKMRKLSIFCLPRSAIGGSEQVKILCGFLYRELGSRRTCDGCNRVLVMNVIAYL